MTGGQLAAFMDSIGVTDAWVATALGVRRDTVHKWKNGVGPIPYRVPGELLAAAEDLARRADDAAATLNTQFNS